jgi:hypothetical protein
MNQERHKNRNSAADKPAYFVTKKLFLGSNAEYIPTFKL